MPTNDNAPLAARRLVVVVAAALVDPGGRVLLAQRPPGKAFAGLWEFPGGKVEPGESPETALVRELEEEIGVMVEPDSLDPFAFASYGHESFHLLMPLYVVRDWRGEPKAKEAAALVWASPAELTRYPMPPADVPLAKRLSERFP